MKRILIIDDNPQIRILMKRALRGYSVQCAERLPQPPLNSDLVLIDCNLAGSQSGFELAREIRATSRGIPVAMMSGDPNLGDIALAHELPFLHKPFQIESLRNFIAGMLSEKYRHRASVSPVYESSATSNKKMLLVR